MSLKLKGQLQSLLNHKGIHLSKYLVELIETCSKEELELITKWGCDGSQQSQNKPKFINSTESDAHIAAIKNIRHNPLSSSVKFCRSVPTHKIYFSNQKYY